MHISLFVYYAPSMSLISDFYSWYEIKQWKIALSHATSIFLLSPFFGATSLKYMPQALWTASLLQGFSLGSSITTLDSRTLYPNSISLTSFL